MTVTLKPSTRQITRRIESEPYTYPAKYLVNQVIGRCIKSFRGLWIETHGPESPRPGDPEFFNSDKVCFWPLPHEIGRGLIFAPVFATMNLQISNAYLWPNTACASLTTPWNRAYRSTAGSGLKRSEPYAFAVLCVSTFI